MLQEATKAIAAACDIFMEVIHERLKMQDLTIDDTIIIDFLKFPDKGLCHIYQRSICLRNRDLKRLGKVSINRILRILYQRHK